MTRHVLRKLGLIATTGLLGCGHPESRATISPIASATVGGAPLRDGRYAIQEGTEFDRQATLAVRAGQPSLRLQGGSESKTLPLKFVGPGPLWHLVSLDPQVRERADLLVLDEARGFIAIEGRGVELSRAQEIPARFLGKWTPVPGILPKDTWMQGLELSPTGGVFHGRGEGPTRFSATWLQTGEDASPKVMAEVGHEGEYLRLAEQDGLLACSMADKGAVLLTKQPASAPRALTLDRLPQPLFIFVANREAFALKCRAEGCDQVALGPSGKTVHWQAAERHAFAVRLQGENPEGKELALVAMADRVLAAGPRDTVALSPLPASRIPPGLVGSWQTSVVLPVEDLDLSEVRVGPDRVEAVWPNGKSSPAHLVQSAFDDGLLLLTARPGLRRWALLRVQSGAGGWFLSRWRDGAGPVVLSRGAPPAWSPIPVVKQVLADFCGLPQHKERIAKFAQAYAKDPRVAIERFAQEAQGRPHLIPAALHAFFQTAGRLDPAKSSAALDGLLVSYNLPSLDCPALADIVAQARKAAPPSKGDKAEDGEPSRAWTRLDRHTQKAAITALNQMWMRSLVFHEMDAQDSQGKPVAHLGFPGNATLHFTPDCCKAEGVCPAASVWQTEPWQSLNFGPPEEAQGLRFAYASSGEREQAQFIAVVAVDPDCTGKPVYVWRRGHVNAEGDITGTYQPATGDSPPALTPAR